MKKIICYVNLVFIVLFSMLFCYCHLQRSQLDQIIWRTVSKEHIVPISQLEDFKTSDTVCILHPYAIRTGGKQNPIGQNERQQRSLKKIFGRISSKRWEKEIIQRHTDSYSWTLYTANDKEITKSFPLKPSQSLGYEMDTGFNAGCYQAASVCLQKQEKDLGKRKVILFGPCPVNAIEAP